MPSYQTQMGSERSQMRSGSSQLIASSFSQSMGNQAQLEQMRNAQGADAARSSVVDRSAEHQAQLESRGVGTHFGGKSEFGQMSDEEKQDWLQQQARDGVVIDPAELTQSSCIEWAMEHVRAWYEATGQLELYEAIEAETRAANLRGTALAQILVQNGWQAWYFNPDTSYRGHEDAPDAEHSYSHHVAETQGTYYDVPLTGQMVNTEAHPERLDALEATPFFVAVARGGLHVTAGVDGQINELAQGQGPDQTLIYQDAYRDIIPAYTAYNGGGEMAEHMTRAMWGSGLIVTPPGSAPLGPEFQQGMP